MRIVRADTGRRTLKYHQTLDEHLGLEPDERALLAELLLRGPQAPGELRTRTERLHRFVDRGEVEASLRRIPERPEPLMRKLERGPGQQDWRWVHLLGPVPEAEPSSAAAPAFDREAVLEVGDLGRLTRPATSAAWYSLIHLAASELPGALAALVRQHARGGWLVLALHAGAEVRASRGGVVRPRGGPRPPSSTNRRPSSGSSTPPAWSGSSSTCAVRSPLAARRPSACTSSDGSLEPRPAHPSTGPRGGSPA